jgi:hypothetical protein
MPKSKRRQTLSHQELESFLEEISTNVPPTSAPHMTDENEPCSNIVSIAEVASLSPVKTGKTAPSLVPTEESKKITAPIEDAPDVKYIRLYCKVLLILFPE